MLDHLIVLCEDATKFLAENPEQFTLMRRNGLGASDSSCVLGLNPFTSREQLIEQKCAKEMTAEEIRVSNLASVRMGTDLEPIVLEKFKSFSGINPKKPTAQYAYQQAPYLTANYDGIAMMGEQGQMAIPVECKVVTKYAQKYWNLDKCLYMNIFENTQYPLVQDTEVNAENSGIPIYYYTQVQQQMLLADAPFCFVAALFVDTWELHVFKIYADAYTQLCILTDGADVWEAIQKRRM